MGRSVFVSRTTNAMSSRHGDVELVVVKIFVPFAAGA